MCRGGKKERQREMKALADGATTESPSGKNALSRNILESNVCDDDKGREEEVCPNLDARLVHELGQFRVE